MNTNSIDGVRVGDHLCGFYQNRQQLWYLAIPFVQRGLERGERCLYVAEESGLLEIQSALQQQGISIQPYLVQGRLLLLTAEDTCLQSGVFSPEALIGTLLRILQEAIAEGYHGLRMAIKMSWILRWASSLAWLAEYESKLNCYFSQHPVTTLCLYNQRHFPEEILLDVLRTHPLVALDQIIYANLYYLPPRIFLRQDKKEQFHWYLTNISRGTSLSLVPCTATVVVGKSVPSALRQPFDPSAELVLSKVEGLGAGFAQDTVTLRRGSGQGSGHRLEELPSGVRWPVSPTAAGRWRIYCLGELRVYRPDGTLVNWDMPKGATRKVRTLFAYLLEREKAGATAERLVDLLWPNQKDTRKGLGRLYHTVHCLRLALEPQLSTGRASRYVLYEGDRYFLALPDDSWIDVVAFDRLCHRGEDLARLGEDDDALVCYLGAEDLYKGDFLADIPLVYAERVDDDWCWSRRYWLREMYLKLFLSLAELHLRRGAVSESLSYWQKALAMDPCCEEAHRGMMRAFYQAGRRDALVRQYSLCTDLLRREEGRAPEVGTDQLYQELMTTWPVSPIPQ
jgi:DNA-binding SARP family transcriptional activator